MSTDVKHVMVRLPLAVFNQIPARKGVGGRNVRAGVSSWITDLVYKALDLDPPASTAPNMTPDLSGIDVSKLDPKTRYIVALYNEKKSVRELVEILVEKNIPTVKGGQWTEDNLRRTLQRLAKKHGV